MTNLIGQSIGRYHILEQLGEGGMATVYKAYDTRLEREVAIKVIRTERLTLENMPKALKRFEREAKSLGKLTHPNIVPVSDYGDYQGKPYLVMPYLPGGTLKARLGKAIPWQDAVRILIPIANALEMAHEHDIIHRDVKPANILITEKGQPMLSDFGVAKILDAEETMELTGTGIGIGTPEYMAPEQVSSKNVDRRADIYALGVVLYEMVTGRKPYIADTPMAVMIMHSRDPLPRPGKFVANLPQKVENVLFKALAKNPNDRYKDMAEFAKAMEGLSHSTTAEIKDAPSKAPRQVKPTVVYKMPSIPRKTFITIGISMLTIGLLVVLSFLLRLLPSALLSTVTSSNTPIPMDTPTTVFTATPQATNTPAATATQELRIGSTMTGEDGAALVYVPAGEFTMGSDAYDDEKPIHTVYLDAFWIDQTEVTNKQYAACVSRGGCTPPSETSSSSRASYYGNSEYDDFPVIHVSWNQASAYCSWAGRELPTEAQWEKAARGMESFTYPWGNGTPDSTLLNFNINTGDTTKAGSYESGKSPYGAYDMAGNVWEWVHDWYGETYYQKSPSSNPLGPDSGYYRVLRGGSWYFDDYVVRSANRISLVPASSDSYFGGFRCARGTSP